MPSPFEQGDEAKEKYLEQALHANDEALSGAKMSDLYDKDSSANQNADKNKFQNKIEKEIPQAPTVDEDGYPLIGRVHTYKADLADIVKEDKLSLSRIAMMQGNANANIPTQITAPQKQSKVMLVVGVSLLMISVGIIGGIFMLSSQKNNSATATPTEAPKEKYLIFAESNKVLNMSKITKSELANFIQSQEKSFREEDSVLEIVPALGVSSTSSRLPIQNIWNTTNARIPSDLDRTLANKFFLGLYSKKGRTDPFLMFYTSSYDIAYPALLNWEGFMQDDFDWLFDTKLKVGTTTPALSWKDRIILNKDVRSFEDKDGKTALFYMFLDDHTILFARTSDTVRKVTDRLREAKFQ